MEHVVNAERNLFCDAFLPLEQFSLEVSSMKRMFLFGLLTVAGACNTVLVTAQVTQRGTTNQVAEPKTSTIDQIILEEYKAIRAEIILCLESRVSIVSLGFAAIGALLAGGVAAMSRERPYWFVSALTIGVAVTLTSLYAFDVWTVETRRLARASHHNCQLEDKMNNLFPGNVKPLEWEHRVRTDDYNAILPPNKETPPLIFLLLSAGSAAGGLVLFVIFLWETKEHPIPKLRRFYQGRKPIAVLGGAGVLWVFWLVGLRLAETRHLPEIWRC